MFSGLVNFAHEVYVLAPEEISAGLKRHSQNPFDALHEPKNIKLFIFFSLLTLAILGFALFIKSLRKAKKLGKFIDKATVFAPDLIRVAFGASLLLSASNNALFGPELPLELFPMPELLKWLLAVVGIGLILGIFSKQLAYLSATLFLAGVFSEGLYMLTYINYLGEAIAVILFPVQNFSFDKLLVKLRKTKLPRPKYHEYSLPVARLLFGFSLIWTALSIKVFDSALSLEVVERYKLADYFPFDPLFIVMGAALVECLIGLLYMLGLLQRFNTVFFLIFLTLSISFFNEDVWPHYLLIALGIGIFLHKPDKLALDKYIFARRR